MENQKKTILCFGDSLTSGFLDPFGVESHPYALKLGSLLGSSWEIIEAGVPGEETKSMKKRLTQFLPQLLSPPSYTILLGGTNDLVDGNVDKIIENLKEMVTISLSIPNNNVILLSIPHHGWESRSEKVKEKREKIDFEMKKFILSFSNRCFYVDIFSHLPPVMGGEGGEEGEKKREELWGLYGLHLSEKGYDLVGEVIYDTVFAHEN